MRPSRSNAQRALRKGTYPDASGYKWVPGKYFSHTIVRMDSPFKNWADLKGRTCAYCDMGSRPGYDLPRSGLAGAELRPFDQKTTPP